MLSLFALGVMSVVWMAVVAGLIAFEKLIPSRRVATYGTAVVLLVLGVLVLAAPDALPGLDDPRQRRLDERHVGDVGATPAEAPEPPSPSAPAPAAAGRGRRRSPGRPRSRRGPP